MKKKAILSLLMTVVMVMMFCTTAFGQSPIVGPDDLTQLPGDDYDYAFGLTKHMIVDADAYIPEETFYFRVEAGLEVPGSGADTGSVNTNATVGPVFPGIVPEYDTATITFGPGDTWSSQLLLPGMDAWIVAEPMVSKYVPRTAYFDFSSVSYEKPGIYRYTIYESNQMMIPSISYDTRNYTLDVVVGYEDTDLGALVNGAIDTSGGPNGIPDAEENGTMSILNYFYYLNDNENSEMGNHGGSPIGAKLDPADVIFANLMESESLTISKHVAGTLGDREKYFAFTVTVAGTVGVSYTVDLRDADATADFDGDGTTDTNPDSITIPYGATEVSQIYYLKDGQKIVIKALPIDTAYSVSEASYAAVYANLNIGHLAH